MWINPLFDESDRDSITHVVRAYPLATLIVNDPLCVSHMPLLLESGGGRGDGMELVGHIPWADPMAEAIGGEAELLAVFQGETSYISPSWYRDPGLPTYNFVVSHLSGAMMPMETDAELRAHLMDLVAHHEARKAGGAPRWSMDAAAYRRMDELLPRITGFRVRVTSAQLKVKVGQNRSLRDQRHVAACLAGSPDTTERRLAERMRASAEQRGQSHAP